jgi:hypothetical protein
MSKDDDNSRRFSSYLRLVPTVEESEAVETVDGDEDSGYFWGAELTDATKLLLNDFVSSVHEPADIEDKITGEPEKDIMVLAKRAVKGEVTIQDALSFYMQAVTSDPTLLSDAYHAVGLVLQRHREGTKAVHLAEATIRQTAMIDVRTMLDTSREKLKNIMERTDEDGGVSDKTQLAIHRELVREMKSHQDFIANVLQMVETSDTESKKVENIIAQLIEPTHSRDAWDEILQSLSPDKQRELRVALSFIVFQRPHIDLDVLGKAIDSAVDAELVEEKTDGSEPPKRDG